MGWAIFSLLLSAAGGRVVVLCADGLSWPDVAGEETPPQIRRFFHRASLGLLNTGVIGLKTRPAVYATMGSGAKAAGLEPDQPLEAAEPWEILPGGTAGEVYAQRMGRKSPPEGIVIPSFPEMLEANRRGHSNAKLGLLGEELGKAGLKTALVGNADTPEVLHREPSLLAADCEGRVDIGMVGEGLLLPSSEAPFGVWLDLKGLKREVREALKSASLVVVDFGDTYRAEEQAKTSLEEVAQKHRERALRRCAHFLDWLQERLNPERDLLIFLSALPSQEGRWPRDRLTFLAALGPGFEGGLLTSPSTKRAGLVTASDLAPTVLDFFGLEVPIEMEGRPMRSVPFQGDRISFLTQMERRADVNYLLRLPVTKGFIYLVALVLVLGLVAVFYGGPEAKWASWVDRSLLAFMAVPLALFLQPLFAPPSIIAFSLSLPLLVALFTSLAVGAERRWEAGVAMVGILTSLAVVADAWRGAELNGGSVLGYHPVVGARFYGIGNEYMGVAIASTLIGMGCLLDGLNAAPKRKVVMASSLGMLAVLLTIGLPQAGANLGGAITASFAFGLFLAKSLKVRVRLRHFLFLLLGVAFMAFLAFALDILTRGETHLGWAAKLVAHGRWEELLSITWRKLSTNLRLLASIAWSRLLLVFVVVMAILLHRPRGLLASILRRRPWFGSALVSSIVAMFVAILVNDSGVVACATMITVTGPPLMHMLLKEARSSSTLLFGSTRGHPHGDGKRLTG